MADLLWGWIDQLRNRQRGEHLLDLIHEAIYEGRPLGTDVESPAIEALRRRRSSPAQLNLSRSMVDTVTARRTKRRPMPVVSADDASWSEKLYAKRVSRVLRRKLARPEVERLKPDTYRDSAIRGTGCVKVFRDRGDVSYERIPRHELVADPREARYGLASLPQLAHVKPYSRERLRAMFPHHAEAIDSAPRLTFEEWRPTDYDAPTTSDRCDVAEAWYLSPGGDACGRHVIAIRGAVLLDEEWHRPRFPIAFDYWSSPVRGIWGHGLVEDIAGIQAKINDLLTDQQEALYWAGALKIFAARGSNVNKAHMRARHPAVIDHDGAVPTFIAPNPIPSQSFQLLEMLFQRAYEISGINQASAASKSALGSNASGKALDTQYDIESDRFAQVELGDAMFVCDLGQLTIDEARAIADDKKAGRLEHKPAKWITEIEWHRVDIDGGDYHLSIEPQNFLPDTRAGRLSFIGELAKAGLITGKENILSLFDEPDMARANRYILGAIRNIERMIEGICDPRVPLSAVLADPHMNLSLAMEMVVGEYNNAQAEGLNDEKRGEEVHERFRVVIDSIKALQSEATAGEAPPAPPGGGMPPGAPTDQSGMPLAAMPPPMATMPPQPTAPGMAA